MNDKELFAALLLTQNLSLELYGCGIDAYFMGDTNEEQLIAFGLGTMQCLMNHACDANTMLLMDTRQMLIYSSKPIEIGEQVLIIFFLCTQTLYS